MNSKPFLGDAETKLDMKAHGCHDMGGMLEDHREPSSLNQIIYLIYQPSIYMKVLPSMTG